MDEAAFAGAERGPGFELMRKGSPVVLFKPLAQDCVELRHITICRRSGVLPTTRSGFSDADWRGISTNSVRPNLGGGLGIFAARRYSKMRVALQRPGVKLRDEDDEVEG